jgi:hypothetical protein
MYRPYIDLRSLTGVRYLGAPEVGAGLLHSGLLYLGLYHVTESRDLRHGSLCRPRLPSLRP